MPIYKYKAKKGPEEMVEAQIAAVSRKDAIEKISAMGILPVKVEEISDFSGGSGEQTFLIKHVPAKQITQFSRQLGVLLRSGVPILSGLNILAEQTGSLYFRSVIKNIHNDVKDGNALSGAFSRYPKLFSPLFLSLIRAGEDSGTLEESLMRIAEYRKKQEKIISSVRTALTYPLLMAIVGIGTIIFMLTFVLPRLTQVFTRLGEQLPLPTRILIAVSDYLRQGWWVLLIILFFVAGFFKFGMKSRAEKKFLNRLVLGIPLIGPLMIKAELARFSRSLQILLKSGIQVLKAIRIATPILRSEIIKDELMRGHEKIEQGESFGSILNHSRVFPKFMVNLVSIGEESGKLDDALGEIADVYETETDESIKVMTNLLEPVMILVMGGVVGFIIISMLLPVFQINMMIK